MATLVFGAVGTLLGGPVGGAVGALLGREVDRAIIGAPTREGPRLTELAASSSSYGQPIAQLYGATRAAGTILWATDLRESSETVGGGKSRPSTREYSYSISFAIALSSRPIERVGRIWADGNLLRGEAGDLKTGGTLRVYHGHADQLPDPLLAAVLGAQCPAHRGLAYAVFEDLQLGDFGNRVPALSFEVFAGGAGDGLPAALVETAEVAATSALVPGAAGIAGFAHDGGGLAQVFDLLDHAVPLVADSADAGLVISPGEAIEEPVLLPATIAWPDGEFGTRTGMRRAQDDRRHSWALRYYDSGRDYQPGFQRTVGRAHTAGERTLELPATLEAANARALVGSMRARGAAGSRRLQVRVASLDPALSPGRVVAVAGEGYWRLTAWEWRSGGVELELERLATFAPATLAGDAGTPWRPVDRLPAATHFDAFELPWDGTGSPDAERVHAAVGAGAGRWAGAALYVERAGALLPIGTAGPRRACAGLLDLPLAPSPALLFEPAAQLELQCDDPETDFLSIDWPALATGANRLLVGEEILQFMHAEPLGGGRWRLSGILRGRGGSEEAARAGHPSGTRVCLLDDRLNLLDGAAFDAANERLAAIGAADPEPVFAIVRSPGRSRRPLAPVHPVAIVESDGALALEWTRRARGAWVWRDGVEVPLVEEAERFVVGAGPVGTPLATWFADGCSLTIVASDIAPLTPGTLLWVRQIGSHAQSDPLWLHVLTA